MSDALRNRIREFLAATLPGITVEGDRLAFAAEEMSSIELVEMAVELEHEFGVKFRLADITEKNFRTISGVAALIAAAEKS